MSHSCSLSRVICLAKTCYILYTTCMHTYYGYSSWNHILSHMNSLFTLHFLKTIYVQYTTKVCRKRVYIFSSNNLATKCFSFHQLSLVFIALVQYPLKLHTIVTLCKLFLKDFVISILIDLIALTIIVIIHHS